jgi:cobalamin-dependent methionine synthase I
MHGWCGSVIQGKDKTGSLRGLSMIIVAERLNAARKTVREAIEERDETLIIREAADQFAAGADIVDINAGAHPDREETDMAWMIDLVQGAVDARISIDSSSSRVILKNIHKLSKTPMINSVSLESKKLAEMRPALTEREADIVALCMDDSGLPKSADQAFDNAVRIVETLEGLGIARQHIFLDPLVQTISADHTKGQMVLSTIGRIHAEIPGVHIICGLSNISYGMPERFLINRTFLTLAVGAGLDAAIIDPLDKKLMTAVAVSEMLLGNDSYCRNYLTQYRKNNIIP